MASIADTAIEYEVKRGRGSCSFDVVVSESVRGQGSDGLIR